jgi:small redox-active disulfide protein 2
MKIEVLGPGCARCNALAAGAKLAADRLGVDYELVKVTAIAEIAKRGVMVTPALVIDGVVKLTGRVPDQRELTEILEAAQAS